MLRQNAASASLINFVIRHSSFVITLFPGANPRMTSRALSNPATLAATLESWFAANGRDYPWRRTSDPYAILVSEMMLQQTQIATVLGRGYFARWMERFPNVRTLAHATEAEVLRTWEGLGYYRRARFLHHIAKTILEKHDGVF